MNSLLGLLQLLLLAFGLFSVGGAVLVALVYPAMRSRVTKLSPAPRARVLRMICSAPLLGALVLAGVCLLPSMLAAFWPQLDHCLTHPGHVHICLIHPPARSGGLLGWPVVGGLLLYMVSGSAALGWRARSAARSLHGLTRSAQYEPALGVFRLDSTLPLCVAQGLLWPRIILSTAISEALPDTLLRVVLAHEREHIRRRDGLWHLGASLCALAHVPSVRHQLLVDLALASELACDEHAAAVAEDRLTVAGALLRVERMLTEHARLPGLAPAFGGSDVAARVESLLGEPATRSLRGRGVAVVVALLAVCILPFTEWHHWTETLLGLLVR